MLNQPTGGFPAIYQEVPSELHMCMRAVYELNMYDITYLHFHNCIEVGMCVSGDGFVVSMAGNIHSKPEMFKSFFRT